MSTLFDRLLSDQAAGVRKTSDGRRIFRQRRVHFETILLNDHELLGGGWSGFDQPLPPLDWQSSEPPESDSISAYAHNASERFLAFWYRIFDVAVARAINGPGREILRQPFLSPSVMIDIGIPEEQALSSLSPSLHSTILANYRCGRISNHEVIAKMPTIHYLCDYLSVISNDLVEKMRPYESLWQLEDQRNDALRNLKKSDNRHSQLQITARSAILAETQRYRYALRLLRFRYHRRLSSQSSPQKRSPLEEQKESYQRLFAQRIAAIEQHPPEPDGHRITTLLATLHKMGLAIEKLHSEWLEWNIDPSDARIIGNPFCEAELVREAKEELQQRLRPVRRSSSGYSTIYGHRHGVIPLNPVLKLWKNRPLSRHEGLPAIASMEINTPTVAAKLIELARLVDTQLGNREIARRSIVRGQRGSEQLDNLLILLTPGSAYPLREVDRRDFPEYRSKVIGESRSPQELGVSPDEESILTGAWYQKNNHTLYYTIGGDNGELLRSIWFGRRMPAEAAFYFALGQYVHDTLKDEQVYHRRSQKTFRQCVENLYDFEDKIRRNRGERSGRRRADNSRAGVRFMFALSYARVILSALTASQQSPLRHPPTEEWLERELGLPIIGRCERSRIRQIHDTAREVILVTESDNNSL